MRNRPLRVVLGVLACLGSLAHAEEPLRRSGAIYDLDFSLGRDRVVVMLLSGSHSLVAETSSLGVLGVLQAAMLRGVDAEVGYEPGNPNRIVSARLALAAPVRAGRVQELAFDDAAGQLEAKVLLEAEGLVSVVSKDPRAQAVLQAAIRADEPLDDLQYDPQTRVIDRVKLRIMR